jgi:hypothetical protein
MERVVSDLVRREQAAAFQVLNQEALRLGITGRTRAPITPLRHQAKTSKYARKIPNTAHDVSDPSNMWLRRR